MYLQYRTCNLLYRKYLHTATFKPMETISRLRATTRRLRENDERISLLRGKKSGCEPILELAALTYVRGIKIGRLER